MDLSVLCDVINAVNGHCHRLGAEFDVNPMSYGLAFSLKDPGTGTRQSFIIESELFSHAKRGRAMLIVSEKVSDFHVARIKKLIK